MGVVLLARTACYKQSPHRESHRLPSEIQHWYVITHLLKVVHTEHEIGIDNIRHFALFVHSVPGTNYRLFMQIIECSNMNAIYWHTFCELVMDTLAARKDSLMNRQ